VTPIFLYRVSEMLAFAGIALFVLATVVAELIMSRNSVTTYQQAEIAIDHQAHDS